MAARCYDDSLSKWLEDKTNLGFLDGLPIPENGLNRPVLCTKFQQQQQEATNTLVQEFESYLGNFEACYQSNLQYSPALTPPQSPPEKPVNNDSHEHCCPPQLTSPGNVNYGCPVQQQLIPDLKPVQWGIENSSLSANINAYSQKYISQDLTVVEPYIRNCPDFQFPLSPCNSSNASCSSIEDPDIFDHMVRDDKKSVKTRNKLKIYSKSNSEDRKVRKKEQNKNAATRYRQKKKQEITEILSEEQELTMNNENLRCKVTDLTKEISYLKKLMREMFRAQGMIP